MKKLLSLAAAAFFMSANIAIAQETTTEEPKGTFGLSGYIDSYYQYNTNKPQSGFNQGRIFDTKHNDVSLGLVQTMFSYSYGKAHLVADLTFGPNAELGNFGNEGTSRLIKQAYLAYDLTDRLSFTIGQFGTHIGYELIDAPLNYNYSLSYLFGNGPFYHTGAKINYNVSDRLGFMVGMMNGWDSMQDFNNKKSVAAQMHVSPIAGLDMYVNWIGGDEYNTWSNFGDHSGSYTSLFDLTTTFSAGEALTIGVNAAYGSFMSGSKEVIADDPWSEDAAWGGAALYLNYAASEHVGLGLRTEYFSDPQGVRYFGPLDVTSVTLTTDIKLGASNFNIKPEVRFDVAKNGFFEDAAGNFTKKSQATVGAAFIYSFSTSK